VTNLVKDLRAQVTKAGPTAGLQVHLAGQLAVNVDQQEKSGSTGNQVEGLSVIFILVLLLLICRSLLAPLITLIPAFLARPGSPVRVPIQTRITAIDSELAGRAAPGEPPRSPSP